MRERKRKEKSEHQNNVEKKEGGDRKARSKSRGEKRGGRRGRDS